MWEKCVLEHVSGSNGECAWSEMGEQRKSSTKMKSRKVKRNYTENGARLNLSTIIIKKREMNYYQHNKYVNEITIENE